MEYLKSRVLEVRQVTKNKSACLYLYHVRKERDYHGTTK